MKCEKLQDFDFENPFSN